mmetsp:Transcript_18985/g.30166  ORF Transcript_18985/g.30166 Transcript_18985/m.30166 type:complete len:222 (-) Transcript_18985:287-952(-)
MTEILLKIIVLGESGVGKTAILHRYIHHEFIEEHKSTIGADFFSKKIDVGRNLVTLQIWDTAGQERFQSLGDAFYRGANACILVFDITSKQSFDRLDHWKSEFLSKNNSDSDTPFPFLLLGNKTDLALSKGRQITTNEADQYAKENNMKYYETSALQDSNIKDAMHKLAEVASAVPSIPVFSKDAIHLMKNGQDEDNEEQEFPKTGCVCLDTANSYYVPNR